MRYMGENPTNSFDLLYAEETIVTIITVFDNMGGDPGQTRKLIHIHTTALQCHHHTGAEAVMLHNRLLLFFLTLLAPRAVFPLALGGGCLGVFFYYGYYGAGHGHTVPV